MSAYLTNPENPQARVQIKGNVDFAEALTAAWVELGIPFYYARTASIDLKRLWIPCFKKSMDPTRVAKLFLADVKKSYNLTTQ